MPTDPAADQLPWWARGWVGGAIVGVLGLCLFVGVTDYLILGVTSPGTDRATTAARDLAARPALDAGTTPGPAEAEAAETASTRTREGRQRSTTESSGAEARAGAPGDRRPAPGAGPEARADAMGGAREAPATRTVDPAEAPQEPVDPDAAIASPKTPEPLEPAAALQGSDSGPSATGPTASTRTPQPTGYAEPLPERKVVPGVLLTREPEPEPKQPAASATVVRPSLAPWRATMAAERTLNREILRSARALLDTALPGASSFLGGAGWVAPVSGYRISAEFGQSGSMWSNDHTGLDLAAPTGTPVASVDAGRVTSVGSAGAYGLKVEVTHADGTETWYCHLSRIDVAVGDAVPRGGQLGAVGATGNVTGPHLHLEVRTPEGTAVDPYDAFRQHGVDI